MSDPYLSQSRPTLPHVVFDQACLRDEALVAAALARARSHGELIVLTEAAFFEMMKSERWEAHYGRALEHLAPHPEGVVGARSLGQMIEDDLKDGPPVRDVVDPRWTGILRTHLANLRSAHDQIRELNREFAARLHSEMFTQAQYEQHKQAFLRLVERLRPILPARMIQRMRSGDREAMVEFLSSDAVAALCVHLIEGEHCPLRHAIALVHEPSATYYNLMTEIGLIVRWIAQGGVESVSADRLYNDNMDMYYVTVALFCSGVVTKDKGFSLLYGILKEALDRRWGVTRNRIAAMGMLYFYCLRSLERP